MTRALAPWEKRRDELVTKAEKVEVKDLQAAEDAVDFIRMARALTSKAVELKSEVQKPYDEAQAAVRNTAQRFIDTITGAIETVQERLDDYRAERAEAARKAQAEQEAEEARLRAENAPPSLPAAPERSDAAAPPPKPRKAAPIRTKLGGLATEQQRWRAKVTDVSLVPAHVLESDTVKDAIAKVAGGMMQHGIAVPGVEKEHYTTTSIR
jgi:hypothetical protein